MPQRCTILVLILLSVATQVDGEVPLPTVDGVTIEAVPVNHWGKRYLGS